MTQDTMSPLERWMAVMDRRVPDRVPMDYWGTDEITYKLMSHLGCASKFEMLQKLKVDFVVTVAGKYAGPDLPVDRDEFGIEYHEVDYGSGVYRELFSHPLARYTSVEEIQQQYRWPDPDWWNYSSIRHQIEGLEHYPIRGGGSEPFLLYKRLRGDQQAMMDLVLNPEIVDYCLEKLFDLAYENTRRIYDQIPGKVTLTYVAEDMGGQENLMFSPSHIRRFLFPGMKRIINLAHEAGVKVFHHNDGNIARILPDLIALGIDALNPIQWRAIGFSRQELKRRYGEQVIFHGGVDNQYTLPFGTVEEVRQEVLDNLAILGEGGGYILAPCHNLQSITPVENVITMYQTGYEAGQSR